ncbi:MAG: hypothetical protein A2365_03300 [Candidatus Nealsonbacteria bacterium RIFOXYB1_FULL_40_15]|uniref:Prepilin peptidase n=2 Tax=Candidatus Nealsoniibacteriota TaxID=1817911 RepID=A0A1G2EU02_9BACT|nr:MAG: hypothetical protein A2365_03300 [Candidatus Nealsonbacteria bacterium RIFOXYB1_FULL_40_15]OGZ28830.1 MAG: hypothetical protein A2427_00205 [Candidatus Nealsonbacteria bacterium RIFOXYC1_FULL_40_7]OGZ29386.1 MAG: hypothetical protein A2562_04740 [Candidatus Nealsonbacteria bacterium RIFOXYD1_FULL_39_11]
MTSIFLDIFIFLLGLIMGSFLTCVIYRLEQKMDFVRGSSMCPKCKHPLAWYDLLPVLSFLFLKGRCRYCKEKISWQYPSIEILTAVVFVWIFNYFSIPASIYYLIITCFLLLIFIYDLKHFIIPDSIVFSAIGLSLAFRIAEAIWYRDIYVVYNSFLAVLVGFAFFFLIFAVSRGKWMGFGDVKFSVFMGLFLGFPGVAIAIFFSFLIGGIIGTGLIISKKKGLKSEVPFGPFLVIGTFIALFWGQSILNWYLNLLAF